MEHLRSESEFSNLYSSQLEDRANERERMKRVLTAPVRSTPKRIEHKMPFWKRLLPFLR